MKTLDELISELEDLKEFFGGDVEVALAMQPAWPFKYSIGRIEAVDLSEKYEDGSTDEDNIVIFMAEDRIECYLPDQAKEQLGW
ncbi:MAG: hypothetical protein ACXAB7_23205 [Candidatus Kariarchaeaceae archaeon]|jgi:hypothetical protein